MPKTPKKGDCVLIKCTGCRSPCQAHGFPGSFAIITQDLPMAFLLLKTKEHYWACSKFSVEIVSKNIVTELYGENNE